jgi:NAD(P)-dependent dehydrogenase (short-subunit alcohol dehydrogenase family)
MDRFSIRDQAIVITGAGKGIGYLMALAFAEVGAKIVAAGRTLADVEATATAIAERGGEALPISVDVTSEPSVDALFAAAVERFGRIDTLVNNAGVYINTPALDTSEAVWDLMTDTNLKGAFFCARGAAKVMIPHGSGRIVSISSALSLVAQRGYASYGATKAGLEQLTRVLALEWSDSNITVNAVAPTSTVTRETSERLSTPEAQAQAKTRIPLGRFCDAQDVIDSVHFLISPAASFITGQTIFVDGGLSLP